MIKRLTTILVILALLGLPELHSFTAEKANRLPVTISAEQWRPLREWHDPSLERILNSRLKKNKRWAKLIRQGRLCVGLVDLSQRERPRFAAVNGETTMYAASLPKLGILLAAFQAIEDGALEETPELMSDLHAMIRRSDNRAASRVMNQLGFSYIEATLRHPRYKLYDPEFGGGLWVGKSYSKSPRRNRDPMYGLSHAASATQVCRFYYLLAAGRLITPYRSRQMLDALRRPGIRHKFVNALNTRVTPEEVYRKSGTWRVYHSDSVLVWGKQWRHYILVALVESSNGEKILRQLLPEVESIIQPTVN